MKKSLLTIAAVAMLAACGEQGNGIASQSSTVDSLQHVINEKDNEINDMMGCMLEIQEGFDLINEAEGRVNMMKANAENGSTVRNIRENMEFIQETLAANKRKIAELENKLKTSMINSAKLKEAIEFYSQQIAEKNSEIESLRAQLAEKDVVIEQLDNTVSELREENTQVREQKEEVEQVAHNQDVQLNTAWYVFGTSRELKEQGILSNGEVLKGDYNKSYFTKIDIRKTSVIPLDSKSAQLLTTHPSGSYSLMKDSNGRYTLRITDANKFWSVSKYLVIKVK